MPQRTCIACRQVRPKRELIRIVRAPGGEILVDETGKANGRGAYLCRSRVCWEKGIGQSHHGSSSPLARALKVTLSEADRTTLLDYTCQLPDIVSVEQVQTNGS
ncbi:MAG: hypothetical protein Kow0063_04800 [Anaerolineae bacterium]